MAAALPLDTYRFEMCHWPLLKRWLYFPLQSMPNALAQQILLSLNWKFGSQSNHGGQKCLFLDQNMHYNVAYALADLYAIHCSEQVATSLRGSMNKVNCF